MISGFFRRLIEIVISLLALVIFLIPGVIISMLILCSGPGGVLYRSRRIGKGEKPFYLLKFRSMVANADKIGAFNVGNTDARITRIGRFLRITKLDELPQFLNVLVGQIGLVGPRPDIEYYAKMYTEQERQIVFAVKPGITDWASLVHYEQYSSFSQSTEPDVFFLKYVRPLKVRLQIYYCQHRSLWGDMRIIVTTAFRLMKICLPLPKEVQRIVTEYHK